MSECERKRNRESEYILSMPPQEIDDNTRRGFLHGFSLLLDILSWMQGMDSHNRQVNTRF